VADLFPAATVISSATDKKRPVAPIPMVEEVEADKAIEEVAAAEEEEGEGRTWLPFWREREKESLEDCGVDFLRLGPRRRIHQTLVGFDP
jgi:hypothetical protein